MSSILIDFGYGMNGEYIYFEFRNTLNTQMMIMIIKQQTFQSLSLGPGSERGPRPIIHWPCRRARAQTHHILKQQNKRMPHKITIQSGPENKPNAAAYGCCPDDIQSVIMYIETGCRP